MKGRNRVVADGLAAAGDAYALITDGDRKPVAVRIPLPDGAAGEADLMLYTDFTTQNAAISERTMALVGSIVLATLVLVGGFLLWLRREIGPLSVMTASLTALSRNRRASESCSKTSASRGRRPAPAPKRPPCCRPASARRCRWPRRATFQPA
jgi:hypothetical protein